jgi:hypothetical protein
MKNIILFLLLTFALTLTSLSAAKIILMKGEIKIRHSVSEDWTSCQIGDILNLEDAIKVGENSSTILLVDNTTKITLTEKTIIDISDLRMLSQEELLLKLAMDKILSVPQQDRDNDLMPARTTIIHGEKKDSHLRLNSNSPEFAQMQLKGTKILYNNSYFATCILRVKEVFRINPALDNSTEYKLLTAQSFEKTNLLGEALNEYNSIPLDNLKPQQKKLVLQNIERLKSKIGE